ncbi:MAG: NrsF family protein [Micropepsaceae bacterium]
MGNDTDDLIEKLARDATPVKVLPSPLVRASVFVVLALAAMSAVAAFAGDVGGTLSKLSDLWFAGSLAGALIAGVAAIISAVVLSVPGRSESWALLPLPGMVLWLASSGAECFQSVAASGWGDGNPFASAACFRFILIAGVPLALGIYFLLRRAVATNLVAVTALGGLGAAMLAAALLQFMHAHGANPVDLATHVVAVALLMIVMMTLGRSALRRA